MTARSDPAAASAIDVHSHFYPPEYVSVVREVAAERGAHAEVARAFLAHRIISVLPHFTRDLDARIRLLDSAGIETQVLSFASLNIWHPDAGTRARLTAAFNDGCSAATLTHPDRLRFLGSLPLPHVDEAISEARRVRELPGWIGYSIPTHIDTVAIDSALWSPVYRAMDETPAIVLAHPDGFCAPGALDDYGMEWAIGAAFEDTIAIVRLVAGGVLTDFAQLTWIIPHLGGTLPFLLHRLLWRWQLEADLLGSSAYRPESLARLLFDTANCSPHTLRLAHDVLPADRIVFGTDFPFLHPTDLDPATELVRSTAGIPVAKILHENVRQSRADAPLTPIADAERLPR